MKVLITGANGFIGKNLSVHLAEREDVSIATFGREDDIDTLPELLNDCDFIFHLAGVNRPEDPNEFRTGNADLTEVLCRAVRGGGRGIPLIYTSSIQADRDNPYGVSKRSAEESLAALSEEFSSTVSIFRLPNVFGKWTKPNYNSAVATFCHNVARDLPVTVNDPSAVVDLVYIDDVVSAFLSIMDGARPDGLFVDVEPVYSVSVGDLVEQITAFKESRASLVSERVGVGFVRALYSTYVSYLPVERFSYEVPQYGDERGVFVEMLKTPDAGQFSFFTAHPGITRGGHYHHSKTEKFLVIKGQANFRFRHILTGESYELKTSGLKSEIVETVPGWTHDITNIGDEEMVVMLWANEIFDRDKPDTIAMPLSE